MATYTDDQWVEITNDEGKRYQVRYRDFVRLYQPEGYWVQGDKPQPETPAVLNPGDDAAPPKPAKAKGVADATAPGA